jgi:microcystin-dependent protein
MGGNKITGVAAGVAGTDVATVSQLTGAVAAPTGSIIPYGGLTAPAGWLLCDGGTYDGALPTYSALYTVIQNRFGGVGISAFKVPNMAGFVPVGAGAGQTYTDLISGASKTTTARSVASVMGEEAHLLLTTELASHGHKVASGGGTNAGDMHNANALAGFRNGFTDYTLGDVQQMIENTGGGQVHNNMQPSIGLTYIIKL